MHTPVLNFYFSFTQAFELSELTGTEIFLLIASESGHIYHFATSKLKPLLDEEEGKI